jgi:hypothetical protein
MSSFLREMGATESWTGNPINNESSHSFLGIEMRILVGRKSLQLMIALTLFGRDFIMALRCHKNRPPNVTFVHPMGSLPPPIIYDAD